SEFEEFSSCGQGQPVSDEPCLFFFNDCPESTICSNNYEGASEDSFPWRCVFLEECLVTEELPSLCEEVELCEAEFTQTIPTLEIPGSDFAPEAFVPEERFAEPNLPDEEEPYPADLTPCSGIGGRSNCID